MSDQVKTPKTGFLITRLNYVKSLSDGWELYVFPGAKWNTELRLLYAACEVIVATLL